MNTASTPNNDVQNPEMQLDSDSIKTTQASRIRLTGCAVYPLDTASDIRRYSALTPRMDEQVREEKGVYRPDPMSSAEHDANPRPYSAIAGHTKQLRKAEHSIDDASNLVRLMLASLDDESDGRAMQTIAGLKVIEKKLSNAHGQIDKHHTQHRNLLLAYFDLKSKMGGED